MTWATRLGAAWAASLLCGLLSFGGCSESSSSNACVAFCDDLCAELEACDIELRDCRSSCQVGLNPSACQGQAAPNRSTCEELAENVACSEYCVALCDRAPTCGSFNGQACATGCLEVGPSICNSASVEARTCEQLKPEIRLYEEAGSETDDDHSAAGGSGVSYGLCRDADDCEEPLGCSQQTNTCAACETNADCANSYDARICNEAKECEEVECVSDADCALGRPCNTETYQCGECREDEDCTSVLGGVCDTTEMKCVECRQDSDGNCVDEP